MGKSVILAISDAAYPLSTTGFGIAVSKFIDGFIDWGFEVHHFARGLKVLPNEFDPPYKLYIPSSGDPNGVGFLQQVGEWQKFDLAFMLADPNSIMEWRKAIYLRRIPNLVYVPTEGGPLLSPWSDTLQEILLQHGAVTTYTQFSRRVIEEGLTIPYEHPLRVLPHGINHAPFGRYPAEKRDFVREVLGWSDKFVVINVARNAGRKMWPRLFDAMRIIKDDAPDVLLYAHTVGYENFFLGGHNLLALRKFYGLEDCIQFPGMMDPTSGIGYEVKGTLRSGNIGLIDLYNAADMFVSVSGAEGWNLPACEAAACGLIVAMPEYSGSWEAAQEFAIGIRVGEDDYETHASGLRFACVHPSDVADTILKVRGMSAEAREARRVAGLEATKKMRWQPTVRAMSELAEQLITEKNKTVPLEDEKVVTKEAR